FLVADPVNNRVVSIFDNALTPGSFFVSPDGTSFFGRADLATGNVTPYVNGIGHPHGWDFVAGVDLGTNVPEPASLAVLGVGLIGMAGLRRRRA
ncbi:MAG TPA: PEP-CTERM sorting domain-containing protein, partial [Acetobacteraceae bacterium]|nr:PEP-CTERM sorting domain-containing protein [Acetobacteraceae bacterium]